MKGAQAGQPASSWRRWAWVAPALAAAALAACGSSPATRYYTLEAIPAPAAASASVAPAASRPPLRVRSVKVPPAFDRLELVEETGPGQIDIRDFDHWAAPLPRLARQALAQNLAARLPKDKLVFPGAPWPEGAADLSVDVLSFQASGGQAVMLASWTIRWPPPSSDAAAPPPLGQQLRLQTATGGDAAAHARAWSDLLAQLADQVAAAWTKTAAQ